MIGLGGLAAKAVLLKEQMKKKPCKRCGLHYDPKKETTCPHCGDLDEHGLVQLLERRKGEFQSNKSLGIWLIFGAIVVLIFMLIGVRA